MSLQRELSSFPLCPQHIHKLTKAGYVIVEDLKGVSPTQLSDGKKGREIIEIFIYCSNYFIVVTVLLSVWIDLLNV